MGEHMDLILLAGTAAGLLQGVGYFSYHRLHKRNHTDPNPYTWFMFAYGVFVLTVLEYDRLLATFSDAHDLLAYSLLALPVVCSLGAIWIFFDLWLENRKTAKRNVFWPDHWGDQLSLVTDIAVTVLYVGCWILLLQDTITPSIRDWLTAVYLFLVNITTIPGFIPMYRAIWSGEEREYKGPWLIWTAAYIALGYATWLSTGEFWHELMFYPAINAVLHALVAVLVVMRPSKRIVVAE